MAMTRTDSPTIRSTNWCWGATRSRAAAWRRSRRSRGSSAPAAPRRLRAMRDALADRVLARHRRRRRGARLITIDLDVTEDETHGAQQLTFFHGFDDHWCYLPLVASLTFDDEARQSLVRRDPPPGQRGGDGWRGGAAEAAAPETLARLSPRPAPRAAGMGASLRRRFLTPWRRPGSSMSSPWGTTRSSRGTPSRRSRRSGRSSPRPKRPRLPMRRRAYQAGTWAVPRRTIIKAEVVWHHGRVPRDNPRFVITHLRQTPEWIYTHVYCARGDSENRFKALKHALAFGRTSCTRFWANQLRVTWTAAAFVLFQELQLHADRAARRGAQVPRLRQALITIGVPVVRAVRRIVLHFPRSHPRRRLVGASRPRARRRPRVTRSCHRHHAVLAPEVSPPTTPIRSPAPWPQPTGRLIASIVMTPASICVITLENACTTSNSVTRE